MHFVHARNSELDDDAFIAAWAAWFNGPGSRGGLPPHGPIPRLALHETAAHLVSAGYDHGLDALCRTLVAPSYRNTMQATPRFVAANRHLLRPAKCINPRSGRTVSGVQLTLKGLEILGRVRPRRPADAEIAYGL